MALAAAAVMSCSESEEIENAGQKAEIKLGTVVGNTTRATVTDLPELQKVGSLCMLIIREQQQWPPLRLLMR